MNLRLLIAKLTKEELDEALEYESKRKITDFGPLFKQPRTYFNFSSKQPEIETPEEIESFLQENGYDIVNYKDGLAIKKNNKQQIGIGKVLNRFKRQDLKKMFDERLGAGKKVMENLAVCFSYKGEDIAGMSTDRGWTSCQDLRGDHPEVQVWEKIEKGGLVAYLIYADDKNIETPLARIAIRRYISKKNPANFMLYPAERCYGIENDDFIDFVDKKISENNESTVKEYEDYEDAEGGYLDESFPEEMGIEGWVRYYNKKGLNKEQKDKILEEVVKSKNAEYIYGFARMTKGLDKEQMDKLLEGIIKTKEAEYIYYFAINIKGLDKEQKDKLLDAVIESKDAKWISYFAEYVKDLTKEQKDKLLDAVIESKDAKYIYLFVKKEEHLTKEQMDRLVEAIKKTKDARYISYFASDVKDLTKEQKDKLFEAIIKTKKAEYIYYFAINIKGLDKEQKDKLVDAIIKIKDASWIYEFVKDVKDLTKEQKEKLNKAVEELKSVNKKYARIANRISKSYYSRIRFING